MTDQDIDDAIQFCLDCWSLSSPDHIEIYHALRILFIRADRLGPSFDDFMVYFRDQYKSST